MLDNIIPIIRAPNSPDKPSFSNKYPPKKRPIITEVSNCNSSFDCNFSKTIFTMGMHKGVNKRRSV